MPSPTRDGLPFTSDRVLVNSFDVHRVLANTIGLADQLLGDLQRTLFSGRAYVYDHTVLADFASRHGIPEAASKKSSQATSTPTQSARTRRKPKRSAPPECPSLSSTVESQSRRDKHRGLHQRDQPSME